jgi:hypothetical protein
MKRQMSGNLFSIGFLAVSILLFGMVASTSLATPPAETGAGILKYKSDVCIEVERSDGKFESVECMSNPNFFTDDGRNLIMHEIGTGASLGATNVIALCNISTGGTGAINCYGNNTASNGLSNATGTFSQIFHAGRAIPGNWSISNQFTSTADGVTVNGTALLNGTTQPASVIFANNTFTAVTLNTNDQITIRWNISIS